MKKIWFTMPVVFLFFAVISLPGCDNPRKIPKDFDYGTWTGSTYKNDFFGFSITMPENWHIANKEEVKALMQEGQEAEFFNKDEVKKITKKAEITTANLFFASRYTTEQSIEEEVFNPNINLVVENLASAGNKIDRAKYVKIFRQNITKMAPGSQIKSETTKTLGGKEFTSLLLEINTEEFTFYIESLVCLEKNFAFAFALIWFDDEEKEQLDAIMATLKWE